MKRLVLLGAILTSSLLGSPASANDVDVNPGNSGYGIGVENDWSPAPAPGDRSSSNPAAPVVDLGTDVRDAFCGGTNYTDSCEPEEAEAAEPVLTLGMITRAFQRVPLPADQLLVQPPGGRTLVNFETNFYTESQPLTRVVTLLGQRITLRATPASWTWTFGDGTTTTTTTPGAAYPDLDVTHTYQREGRVAASVATTYTATYSVGGGPTEPVPGTVTIDGPPAALQIDPARPQLVDYR